MARRAAEAPAREAEAAAEAYERTTVDEEEARWLIARTTEDDIHHDNERALLIYLKEMAPEIHPSLDPLFERFGLTLRHST